MKSYECLPKPRGITARWYTIEVADMTLVAVNSSYCAYIAVHGSYRLVADAGDGVAFWKLYTTYEIHVRRNSEDLEKKLLVQKKKIFKNITEKYVDTCSKIDTYILLMLSDIWH